MNTPLGAAFAGLCALVLGMGIGRFAYTPVLPYMQADFGLSIEAAGYVASANFAGYLAGALLAIVVPAARRRQAFLAAVALSVLTTLVMAVLANPWAMAAARALSGVASAFILIHGSAIVLDRLARDGRPTLFSLLYAGVGAGIVLSALIVEIASRTGGGSAAQWLALGLVSLAFAPLAAQLRDDAGPPVAATPATTQAAGASATPSRAAGAADAGKAVNAESAVNTVNAVHAANAANAGAARRQRALRWLIVAYGCLGFGYVITVTFIVVMVRTRPDWQPWEMLVWLVVGMTGAPSNYLWLRAAQRIGPWRALIIAYLLEAAGVAAAVSAHSLALVMLGAGLVGGTFMGITALGLTTARGLSPGASGPVIARMTAAFGVGQIVGPAFGGWLAERSGGFGLASLAAATALVAAAGMVAVAARHARAARFAPTA
jgi:predicted MFS family arabinose efflux permease